MVLSDSRSTQSQKRTLPPTKTKPATRYNADQNDEEKKQWVYLFSAGQADGDGSMKSLLGGKGAGLSEMSLLSLPVPPGLTIPTTVCQYFNENAQQYPSTLKSQVKSGLRKVEALTSCKFGDVEKPLLFSVRSGASVSMPGMMDTVLNLGLNDETVKGLEKQTNNKYFALDSYRRFIQMFGNVVMNIDMHKFDQIFSKYDNTTKQQENLNKIIQEYKLLFKNETGIDFVQDVYKQLWYTINAVFKSWNNSRAITYRKLNNISSLLGTAVTVQSMVFGNMGESSATGVVFTRNPSTGENIFYGEYLKNAQGEDVVAGIRTPNDINKMKQDMPKMYDELLRIRNILETHFKEVQDIEFTIQQSTLYILQTRNAKRSSRASVKIAVDMVNQGIISKKEAILRIDPLSIKNLLHPTIDPNQGYHLYTKGLPASPGAAFGKICLSANKVKELHESGEKDLILCTEETSPDDIEGMHLSKGMLTKRGGMTSHAAVVARGMGTPAVTGAGDIQININEKKVIIGNKYELKEGDIITIDGSTGEVMKGQLKTIDVTFSSEFDTLMKWIDEYKRLTILTNAETPDDVLRARNFGAKGVGLCRTEHMFFHPQRLPIMRQMILANNKEIRNQALDKLLPFQIKDFEKIFEIMNGHPVTIRFLDPPLHEFLPESDEDINQVIEMSNISKDEMMIKLKNMKEVNPMLGLRGCRVSILYPEIYMMQTKAAIQAAIQCNLKLKKPVEINLMVPFISSEEEIEIIKTQITKCIENLLPDDNHQIKYQIGTMIELPRAALKANDIALHAEFFSFGTNDLTQTCFGLSRDDSSSFINHYERNGIVKQDPFVALDVDGVGELIKIAIQRGLSTRSDLKLCLCGEQGGHPDSVKFCHNVGLHAVSCSPFLVPVARIAAAQAAIMQGKS
uniref:Pyruvate, phosphate dikinase n=1 Tax=Symphyocladia latiuscula TaxID=396806 RepID=A0A097IU18_9FLOR|nr:pyruvate orthophosphate dikinase [Symphyocladia latiuscula]